MNNNSKKKCRAERDEVEELLQAAQDEMLLKMSLNSHMARGSSSQIIDPDLDRRFQTLKSNKKTNNTNITKNTQLKNPIKSTKIDKVLNEDVNGDEDLFGRFAALKKSLPSHQQKVEEVNHDDEDEDEDDEVEKVIRWAMDAARLDPSPASDSDEEKDDEDDDDDDDDESVKKGKKGKGK